MNQPHCAFDEMPADIDDLTFRIALRAMQQQLCPHCGAKMIASTPAQDEKVIQTDTDEPPSGYMSRPKLL